MSVYFEYGEKEIEYLTRKDKRLGEAISKIGHIYREVNGDLFSSAIHHIVGQQISSAALKTVWARLNDNLGEISSATIRAASREDIQTCGITFKKADSIKDFAEKVHCGEFNIDALRNMPDAEVVLKLSGLKGIGVWTAEMLMIFSLQRPNIVSYGDLGIQRGLRMLYHHRKIDRKMFDKYARRYAPYGTVASLYLWAIAGGAIPEMPDVPPEKKK
jgi:DNA-3-methyladenine glycosylase II